MYICIAGSLRLLQHVETVQVPCSWESLNSKTWKEVKWEEKRFEVCEIFALNYEFGFKLYQVPYMMFCLGNLGWSWKHYKNYPGRQISLLITRIILEEVF